MGRSHEAVAWGRRKGWSPGLSLRSTRLAHRHGRTQTCNKGACIASHCSTSICT